MDARRSYRRERAAALAALVLVTACAEERVVERTIVLRLPDATSCAPASPLASLRLRALGDGPGEPSSVLAISPDAPVRALPELSYPTQVILATAEAPGWRGIGWRVAGSAGDEIALLPPGRSCAIGDPDASAPEGASLAVLADGSLFVAGGLDAEGRATSRVVLLPPGAQVGEPAAVRLALPCAFGTATALEDGRVIIAGGAISASAPAYDQLEILDPRVDAARRIEPLATPRRDHSALRLRDGRVVLVGGRASGDDDGAQLESSIEIVDPERGESTVLRARLRVARIAPWLGLAEDGRVWIAGGAARAEDVAVIERLDVSRDEIEQWQTPALPAPLALAGLDGDRLAWVGTREVHVVALHDDAPSSSKLRATPALDTARAVGVAGRVLVGASEAGARLAYLLDPGTGVLAVRDASRVPSALVAMVDDSVVELNETGASLRREEAPTPFDDPPATLLFAADEAWWVLDPVGRERWDDPRFEVRGGELVAIEVGARADLRALRGSRFDVELTAQGAVELRAIGDEGVVAIAIDDDEIALGDCLVSREPGEPASIAIDPGRVRLGIDRECETALRGMVRLAFVAREPGAALRSVRIARR